MDRGIDWRNADFRNPDGSTRIAYIFDLTDDSGAHAPGNSYQMGTIYTREQINEALRSSGKLQTRVAVGHGTTTAGIASGNGRNGAGGKYRGVAINGTIIVVKIVSDGAPAHDDQPAESAFYRPERIPVAIDFLVEKAREMKLPCMMVLNIGSVSGSRDGSSDFAWRIDAQFGPGKPGLVFVSGSGDDGGWPNHAAGTVRRELHFADPEGVPWPFVCRSLVSRRRPLRRHNRNPVWKVRPIPRTDNE